MNEKPIVSIGFPVYNGERYLRLALDSLLAQDHPSFEIVLSNNGSTDSTDAICTAYARQDPRIHYLSSSMNRGAAWNFNHVVNNARGKYFMWAAHDDIWRADCLSLYSNALDRDARAVLVYCRAQPIGSEGQSIGPPYSGFANDSPSSRARFRRVLEHWELHAAIYGMFRIEALKRTRLLLSCVSADVILIAEVALQGTTIELAESCSMKRIPDPGVAYRTRAEQLQYLNPLLTMKRPRRFLGFFVTLEAVKALTHARLDWFDIAPHTGDAAIAYLRHRASIDLKEEIHRVLAVRQPRVLKFVRAMKRWWKPASGA